MEIREARIEDCEQLVEGMRVVVCEARWLATESDTSTEELLGRYRGAVESPEHILLVLEDHGTLVGCIGMHPTLAKGVLSLGMWLLPEWRGKGHGRTLMEAALEARPGDAHKIELEVFPDNQAAIALYRSMGFEQEGVRRDHYRRLDGSLRSAVIMARLF
jgi:[ribosomal protein S18]-alanine N-acetyltransferase